MNAPARTFEARPAIRAQVPLLIGIMSPSGGGKTYSALRLATGIQQVFGGKIFGVDTENNRMLHYADKFKFEHVPFTAPFGSLDYLECLRYCAGQGSRITIVDSMTHEHIGEGGYLETAEQVVNRIAGDDYKKREAAKFAGWAKAGPLRTKMIEGIKQLNGNFIFCWRAKEKTKPMKVNGKFEAVELGLMPIAGEEWVYEMTVNCMLPARSEGVPMWRSDHVGERLMMKLPAQFKDIFAESAPLSEDIGRALAEWAKGGTTIPPRSTGQASVADAPAPANQPSAGAGVPFDEPDSDEVSHWFEQLADAAKISTAVLGSTWTNVPKNVKPALKAALDDKFKPAAKEADKVNV